METEGINLLIKDAIPAGKSIWADFGSGDGNFTLALRRAGGPDIEIYSVDRDSGRLQDQRAAFQKEFPQTKINFIEADFTAALELPLLDGVLMANSLHFVKDKIYFLDSLKKYLKPAGMLLLVEYDTDRGNPYVPYPISFESLKTVAVQAGFAEPKLFGVAPSKYQGQMYSAGISAV